MADRSDLLFNLDLILGFASKLQKEALSGQTDLFASLGDSVVDILPSLDLKPSPTKHTEKERLTWERELLGLYLSSHPLDPYAVYLNEQTVPLDQVTIDADGKGLTVGGIISTVRAITTKNGSKMAFLKLEDKFGETEIVIFPKLYQEIGEQLLQDTVIKVNGRVNARNQAGNLQDEAKVIVEKIIIVSQEELDNYQSTGQRQKAPATKKGNKKIKSEAQKAEAIPEVNTIPTMYIHVKDTNDHDSLREMKRELSNVPGENQVILVLGEDKASAIRLPFTTNLSEGLITNIKSLYGSDQVVVK